MEPEDIMDNQCGDLVSLKRLEPALVHLFQSCRPGEWVSVAELYRIAGASDEGIKPGVAATWFMSPTNQTGYVIVLFCDDELMWSMTAYYNAARLLESTNPTAAAPNLVR